MTNTLPPRRDGNHGLEPQLSQIALGPIPAESLPANIQARLPDTIPTGIKGYVPFSRAYVTVLDGDMDLLPYFVKHYARLGVSEFHILIYGHHREMEQALSLVELTNNYLQLGVKAVPLGVMEEHTFSARNRDVLISNIHGRRSWAFFTDLDEFCQIGVKRLHRLAAQKAPYIKGRWLDRFPLTGSLQDIPTPHSPPGMDIPSLWKDLLSHPTLDNHFPGCCRVRERWKMGEWVYVAAPFGPYMHHPNVCEKGKRNFSSAPLADVHHFRWQQNVITRLERRLRRIREAGKGGSDWEKRVGTMLSRLKKDNGIPKDWLEDAPKLDV